MGATYGRTTLNGEGLQHQDGHSLLMSSTNPAVMSYDPAFAFELAVIVKDGLDRMLLQDQDVMYYLAVYNEPCQQPPLPEGVAEGVLKGLYLYEPAPEERTYRAQIFGSGPILQQALRAQQMLAEEHDVAADVWSATSYQQLRVEALEVERWNRLHPEAERRKSYVSSVLDGKEGPVIAVSDSIKAVPDQISRWVPQHFLSLGTDGFGRSDSREALRRHFEIDPQHIVVATLAGLAEFGDYKPEKITDAIERYQIDPERVWSYFA
jgi:pyruvate dehydrogenase E1 component